MNLVIDIGNSFTKVALVDNGNILSFERHDVLSLEILDMALANFKPTRAIVSNVGNADDSLISYLQNSISTFIFSHTTKIPIINSYTTPQTLGLDRLAAAIGANFLYPSIDLLVIDSGTAITYDIINNKATYLGGAISPGISLRYKSLHQYTANLPHLNSLDNTCIIGKNTVECIESGVLNGIIGEVDHFIDKIKAEFPTIKVVLTGGDANFFANKLKNSIFVIPNLVIIGLNRILDFNAEH